MSVENGNEIRSFLERVETIEAERKALADDVKEIWAEAKSRGYSVTILRELVKLRKKSPDDRAEDEAVLDLYKAALGM